MQTMERRDAWNGGVAKPSSVPNSNSGDLLSKYGTNMRNARIVNFLAVPWWYLKATLEARRLYGLRNELGYNALNVLAKWFISHRQRYEAGICTHIGMQKAASAYKRREAKAYEYALACTARALWASMGKDAQSESEREYADDLVKYALSFEDEIRAEYKALLLGAAVPMDEVLQGLRQFVRVLKEAGVVRRKFGEPAEAKAMWERARTLARGEAQTKSQAKQLGKLLRA